MKLPSSRLLRTAALAGAASVAMPLGGLVFAPAAIARPAPDSFADLAAKLLPAVVNISSTTEVKTASGPDMPMFPPGSPFEQFFKDFMNRHRPGGGGGSDQQPPPDERRMQSLGSGFIIDASGLVVTNNHVIEGADEITVTLQDNTSLKATVVGRDTAGDIALLKVHSDKPLPALQFGDSTAMRIGDWVLAIGNPFGLGGTVTAGIVSARGRDIHEGPYDDFIQTDAPINRGNSGGPLFNMDGQVIGINTAIYSPSGGSIGIGFAIPANMAKMDVDQLRQFGHPRRGWLGVRIQEVTPDIAESLGLHPSSGAMVAGVNPNGPADKAHLRNGDVILQFNNQDVKDMRALPRIVADFGSRQAGSGSGLARRQASHAAGHAGRNARRHQDRAGVRHPGPTRRAAADGPVRPRHEAVAGYRRNQGQVPARRSSEGRRGNRSGPRWRRRQAGAETR